MSSIPDFNIEIGTTGWGEDRNTQLQELVEYLEAQEVIVDNLGELLTTVANNYNNHVSGNSEFHNAYDIKLPVDPFGVDANVQNVLETIRSTLQYHTTIPTLTAGEISHSFNPSLPGCLKLTITLSDDAKKSFITSLGGYISVLVKYYDETGKIRDSKFMKVSKFEENGDVVLEAGFGYNINDKKFTYAAGFGILNRGEFDYTVISDTLDLTPYIVNIGDYVDYDTLANSIIKNMGIATETQEVTVKISGEEQPVEMVTGIKITKKEIT